MNTKTQIGIGVVGCGHRMAALLPHIPGLGGNIEIRRLADPDPLAIQEFQADIAPRAKASADAAQLAADPAVDWVFVGSPNALHPEHAIVALEAGKDVFCEKPLATTVDDALRIRQAHQASGRTLALGFVLRYTRHGQALRRIIDSGVLGNILSLEFNETLPLDHGGHIHGNAWRRLTSIGGGHMLEKCSHDIDLISWLLDARPVRVASFGGLRLFTADNANHAERIGQHESGRPAFQGWGLRRDGDPFAMKKDIVDHQVAILEFDNQARATFHTHCATAIPERRLYLCGDRGTLRADFNTGLIEVEPLGYNTTREQIDTNDEGGHGGGDRILGESLAETMLRGQTPLASVKEGIVATAVALAIDQARTNSQVVDLTPLWQQIDETSPHSTSV
ncbi:Gfo/Idh/MocA family protein [Phycisphaerales bacterium AB-hyl4]|uniref:Gfo/Idh/MocA family protein n=1 Tax=Natronomicrosphaera hydrolytica TaxID=3242702 RepID=A0ABV4U2Y5_9BACT